MSGLRSERLKSWKEEKEEIMKRLACSSHPCWEFYPHVRKHGIPSGTHTDQQELSTVGSQDKEGGEREVWTLSHSPQ